MNNMNFYVNINTYDFDLKKYITDFIITLEQVINLDDNKKIDLINKNREYIKENHTYKYICDKFGKNIFLILNNFKNYRKIMII